VVGSSFAPSQPTACPSAAVALLAAPPAASFAPALCTALLAFNSWWAACAVQDQTCSGLRGLARRPTRPVGAVSGVPDASNLLCIAPRNHGTIDSLSENIAHIRKCHALLR